MRWENLTIEAEERARLPGYREEAVVRHFEAPGAVRTRFYEVRAKSIINRVPAASRMPFRWTLNPYRGCTHACNYCLAGDTSILMADGRTKPLRELGIGDEIYGTSREGVHREFTTTTVLDKWSSIQRAYAVVLEDGTQLVTSDEHRFLSESGWKYVIGTNSGPLQRPHLTYGLKLLGLTGAVEPPEADADYRRGYLCGLIRGDGCLGRWERTQRDGHKCTAHSFYLILTDHEALERALAFLESFGISAHLGRHLAAAGNRRATVAVRSARRASYDQISELITWPASPSLSWQKGFLAGIFDAEGSRTRSNVLCVSNGDSTILNWTIACLDRLGFKHSVCDQRGKCKDGVAHVRVLGGLAEHMRFLLTTDPAITRKRSIVGRRLWTTASLRVASVRPLGTVMRMYDITTGTGDFIANGVVSHNCFARPTHTYLDFNAGEDFEREIVVKVNAPELLRKELARPSWEREHVALGTNTDPYQWVEGRYKLMPGIWEAMRDAANPCSILTKSPLLLRDLEVMKEIAARTEFSAALSVPTIDEKAWRATEPHTPNPRARLEAVAELTRAGIRTGVLIAPLQPGINDQPEQVSRIVEMATEAGAAYISGIALHLRGEVRELWFEWLRANRPDLIPRYQQLYRRGAYMQPEERRRLAALVKGPDLEPGARGRGRGQDPAPDGDAAPDGKDDTPMRRGEEREEEASRRKNPQATLF